MTLKVFGLVHVDAFILNMTKKKLHIKYALELK